ncbi:hypothetical protein PRIPAC_73044 [Pristionchus pacificus]|uniref:ADP ribosylation factor n=1 Tax=Pristionchus pacificus TaxID=54126 RepID=A0A2A6D012_PRIPA|nr:hypothetical protein PRIPAC_73044 [Pristionchus pacificus]|eukprot:PDM83755.1 ADP ribosylation factor [Pristionchus pacificus]
MSVEFISPRLSHRVVLLGDVSVGKSALVHRFIHGEFLEHYNTTIGTAFQAKRIPSRDSGSLKEVLLEIWDTAGQERFHSVIPMYYRRAQAAIIVYDTHAPSTFEKTKMWMEVLRDKSDIGPEMIAVVGNKDDLKNGLITEEEGREYAESEGAMFFETSALNGMNVDPLFFKVAQRLANREIRTPSTSPIQLLESPRRNLRRCCEELI